MNKAGIAAALAGLVIVGWDASPAHSFAEDGCEKQRAQYPKVWDDTAKDETLFDCEGHSGPHFLIKLGAADKQGRALMSMVPAKVTDDSAGKQVEQPGVYRMWLDKAQAKRLRDGVYFATVVRTEQACWIRGDMEPLTFVLDTFDAQADRSDAGSFYNLAPRFSSFNGQRYTCTAMARPKGKAKAAPVKDKPRDPNATTGYR